MLNIEDILDRIKTELKIKNDAGLAKLFNFHQANIKNWRERGTIPWDMLYALCRDKGWSFDWLISGTEINDKIAVDNPVIKSYTKAPLDEQNVESVENAPIHEQIDYIITHGDDEAVNALKFGIQGVLKVMGDKGRDSIMLERIATRMDVLTEAVVKMLELRSDTEEGLSPLVSGLKTGGKSA